MKVSVITVAYNAEKFILDNLKSVSRQTKNDVEHLVVDGGSEDSTLQKVRNFNSRKDVKVSSGEDKGPYDAMNKGLEMATGEVVGFLNSDDLLARKDALDRLTKRIRENSLQACYCDVAYVKRRDINRITRVWREPPSSLFARLPLGWCPCHPSFYAKKKVYEEYGKFDIKYYRAADFDFFCRFFSNEESKFGYIPQCLVKMREGGNSNDSITSVLSGNIEAFDVLKKNGIFPYFVFAKPMRKTIHYLYGAMKRWGNKKLNSGKNL
jgi:glycosyltransferase